MNKICVFFIVMQLVCSAIFASSLEVPLIALGAHLVGLKEKIQFFSPSELRTLQEKYKNIFKFIPENYDLEKVALSLQKELKKRTDIDLLDDDESRRVAIDLLVKPFDGTTSHSAGYNFITLPYFTGKRKGEYVNKKPPLWHMLSITGLIELAEDKQVFDAQLIETKKTAVEFYKIHLMPKEKDLVSTVMKIVELAAKDPSFGKLIAKMKFKHKPSKLLYKKQQQIAPLIVIYPAKGQDAAQQLLSRLLELFKGVEGINITPRFNRKVNSLMYYAQGDADYKNESTAEFLDDSIPNPGDEKWALFKPDLTGEIKDYSLKW